MVQTTILYAGLLGAVMAILSIRVPLRRGALGVPYGDGEDERLATRIRAFGNFTEYVPMILLVMALLEMQGSSNATLHVLGSTLFGARLVHATTYRGRMRLSTAEKAGRGLAAMTTWLVLVGSTVLAVLAGLGAAGPH